MSAAAALKVAVVGPTHPYKGGVAAHTTMLAHHLAEAGHDVTLVSWSHLYPSRLYPGEQAVPGGAPDVPPFPRTVRPLSWARPDSWVRTGRRLRDFDAVVVVHVIPAVVPAHLALLRAARRGRGGAPGPRTVVVAHNVLPHETHPGDAALMRALLSRVDGVLVHSAEQERLARDLGAARVCVAELPPHLPGGSPAPRPAYDGPPRLLALGIVREYKGVDLLVRALTQVPDLRLTIAGELWGASGQLVRTLAADPRVRDRVRVEGGYVPADRIAPMLADHDVLALTYRTATASQNALLGHAHGLPVLASDVGTFGEQVRDGVDGLVVPPGDEGALVGALRRLADPGEIDRLRRGVQPPDLASPWLRYVGTLESLTSPASLPTASTGSLSTTSLPPASASGNDSSGMSGAPGASGAAGSLRRRARSVAGSVGRPLAGVVSRVREAVLARRPVLPLSRTDLPAWVAPSDVLVEPADAGAAAELARDLGLPRPGDPVAAWAALGALGAIVRLADDGSRTAVILDASGPRSPLRRWGRSIGFAPVELDAARDHVPFAGIAADAASLDVITCVHPGGCTARDVGDALGEASRTLRPGGLFCLTLPLGPPGPGGAVGPAEVRGLMARAHGLGLVLVGDLDGDLGARLREAGTHLRRGGPATLVRLTFRRR